MTSIQPTENGEMSGRILGIIGAYRMGAALDARALHQKRRPKLVPEAPPEPVPAPAEGYIRNGVYHLASIPSSRRS